MRYILLDIGYQEVFNGQVLRLTDLDGNTIMSPGYGGAVLDANPPAPAWALPDPVAEQPAPYVPPTRRLTKLAFVGRLGSDFTAILQAAKMSVEVEAFVKMLDWATPDADGTSVDLDDPRVTYALGMLEAGGLLAEGRAAEVLNA
jgi:hypothetical protein